MLQGHVICSIIQKARLSTLTVEQIASAAGCSVGSVVNVLKWKKSNEYSDEDLENMTSSQLFNAYHHKEDETPNDESRLPDFTETFKNVTAKPARSNLRVEWEVFIKINPNGYSYPHFSRLFKLWLIQNKGVKSVTMAINRKPGEFMYIDWIGDKLPLVKDPDKKGGLISAHFFITTMGVSSLIFVKAFPDEKEASVIDGTKSALKFYGGLPKAFRPDNMRTIVSKNDGYEISINPAFHDLELNFNTPVLPARVHKPRDKGSCESAVRYVEQRVLSQIKLMVFDSFPELNAALQKRVDDLNNMISTTYGSSRRFRFEKFDRPLLRDLPEDDRLEPYQLSVHKVPGNYHIKIGNYNYSVPYKLYSKTEPKKVLVKQNGSDITICTMDNKLICRHKAGTNPMNRYITIPEHRPKSHDKALEGLNDTKESIQKWADSVGYWTSVLIKDIMSCPDFPEYTFKTCRAILSCSKKHERKLCEECARIYYTSPERPVKLKNFRETLAALEEEQEYGKHENIHGEDSFK